MTSHLRPRNLIIGATAAAAAIAAILSMGSAPTEPRVSLQASTAEVAAAPPATTTATEELITSTAVTTPSATAPTNLVPTTSTTVIETAPIAGVALNYRQPNATLRSAQGEADGVRSSSCWKVSPTSSLCACGPGWDDPETSIAAEPGETLSVTYDRNDRPRKGSWSVADSFDGDAAWHDDIDPGSVAVPAPTKPGTYWVHVSTWWPEGDVLHVFKIVVNGTHPATATGSILGGTDGDPDKTTVLLTSPDGSVTRITPDGSNRFRFDGLQAGTYELEATIESYAPYTAPGEPQVGTAKRTEIRTVELTPGEVERVDFVTGQ